ncbi:hypothetical protein [Deinococcus sonorensis]|uniref:Uncharacterized protein n=2 Tax=Deinococcus sonorensis TaxID=309891 RepID=A0AAU7U687_9DEIO
MFSEAHAPAAVNHHTALLKTAAERARRTPAVSLGRRLVIWRWVPVPLPFPVRTRRAPR